MTKIARWITVFGISVLALTLIASIILKALINPDDYLPEIEAIAKNNGLDITIGGPISLSIFPQLGVTVNDVEFSHEEIKNGFIEKLGFSFSWLSLLNTGAEVTNLPLDVIHIERGRFRFDDPTLLPIQVDNVSAQLSSFSLKGEVMTLNVSADVLNGLNVSLRSNLTARLMNSKLSQLKVYNLQIQADQVSLNGAFSADLAIPEITGNVWGSSINLRRQLQVIQQRLPIFSMPDMASNKALTDVSIDSEFNANPWGYSYYNHKLSVDNQFFEIAVEADQTSGKMTTNITGDLVNLHHYLPEQMTQVSPTLFAPLALPFIFWQGHSTVTLAINEILLPTFDITNLYSQFSGSNKVLQLSSLNADLFNGQINASAVFDLQKQSPVFSLQGSVYAIDLSQMFPSSTDIEGQFRGDFKLQGTGRDLNEIQQSLVGQGQFSVQNPFYGAISLEQSVCQANALFSGNSYAPAKPRQGTYLDSLFGTLQFKNGEVIFKSINTGTGNIKLQGNGRLNMLQQDYQIDVNASVEGPNSSSDGCAIDQQWQNRPIPFSCAGNYSTRTPQNLDCRPNVNIINTTTQRNMKKNGTNSYLHKLQNSITQVDKTDVLTEKNN
ncbi:MAG: AsmA family protein [Porticoccaceae bacterium]|nr:AsmA family protein [Porticoccaceae bacterium]